MGLQLLAREWAGGSSEKRKVREREAHAPGGGRAEGGGGDDGATSGTQNPSAIDCRPSGIFSDVFLHRDAHSPDELADPHTLHKERSVSPPVTCKDPPRGCEEE